MYDDFEKTKGKLETVLDTYQMKMELRKKLKKRTMVHPHILLFTCCHAYRRPTSSWWEAIASKALCTVSATI